MSDKPKLVIKNVILCDDIRREDNGKFILIGVYTQYIAFPRLPAHFAFMLWVEMDQPDLGKIPFGFRGVMKSTNYELFEMAADAMIKEPQYGVFIPVGPIGALIGSEDTISIQTRQYEGEWIEVRAIPVKHLTATSASAPQQPA